MNHDTGLVIRGARVLDPGSGIDGFFDVAVQGDKVAAIDKPGAIPTRPGFREIQASGMWLLPGLIDLHVHLREPGFEYKETIRSGTEGAVRGGFTSVACMANTEPVNDSPYVTAFIRERAKETAACRVFPVGAVSVGLKGESLAEIGGMVREGARLISDDGMPVMNSYLMRKAMDYAKAFGVAIVSHAEDANLVGGGVMNEGALSATLGLRGNPAAAEEIMVAREIALSRLTRCPVHIAHLSTFEGIELVRRAKDAGLNVTAEATPHHLLLTEEAVSTYDTNYKMAPPLRSARDREALVRALADGTVDAIATDHAPHGLVDKAVEFDNAACGILGLESAIPATYGLVKRGLVGEKRWVESLTRHPAKLLGLGDELGAIRVGKPADLTLFNPGGKTVLMEERLASKSANSPFLGAPLPGKILMTIVGGKVRHESE